MCGVPLVANSKLARQHGINREVIGSKIVHHQAKMCRIEWLCWISRIDPFRIVRDEVSHGNVGRFEG